MKTKFFTLFKIEFIKLIKRKDWLALLALVAIGVLLGAAVAAENYSGAGGQSAFFWMCTQSLNSTIICISPILLAFVATRFLAGEIEQGSILLYTCKYRNRGKLYLAKSLALTGFAAFAFLVMCLVHLLVYYIFVIQNQQVASGMFWGSNTLLLSSSLFTVFLSSFLLTSQLSLVLSTFMKPTPIVGILFIIVLVSHNTGQVSVINKLNPFYYIIRLSSKVAGTTEKIAMNLNETVGLTIAAVLLTVLYLILFNLVGKRRFEKMDL